MDENQCVGTVKGPGETPHEYTFIAPDPDRRVKHGEFVYYWANVEGESRQILGRVTGRRSVQVFPDSFMADPSVPPDQMAALLGYDSDASELFEITVAVLGYHSTTMREFINPRVPPAGGASVFIADDELLAKVLSRRKRGDVGSVYLGSLLSRELDAVPVALDAYGFTSTHLAIIAGTGSGKSYLAGVLLEEMMMPYNRAAIVILDPHGEYSTLQEMQNRPEFSQGNYRPKVRIFRPDTIRVRVDTLTLGDLRYLLPNMTEKMHYQLGRAHSFAMRSYHDKFTIAQLEYAVRQTAEGGRMADDEGMSEDDPTTGGLIWRIGSALKSSQIFNDHENLELEELFRPGQCTVIQLNEVDRREQQVVAATLLRRIYDARLKTEKKLFGPGDKGYIPYPVFVLIEEAHNFAPASADAVSTEVLKTILSEGRKFGVSVGLISQRPGKLDSDVLSQCMTQCIMRIVNPIDQNRIAESVESVGRDLLHELPSLSKGQVIISGASVNTPIMLRVRTRITSHGGQDVNAPEKWMEWFATGEDTAAERVTAPFSARKELPIEEDGDVLWA
jgi:DNA helicase HerA-like ATPase